MEERLRLRNMDCMPLIFEVDGATTGTWARYLNKLSEIAHTRRGHNPKYFAALWKTRVAMTLAKRGAQVAIRRSHDVRSRHGGQAIDFTDAVMGPGPLGSFGSEPPQQLAADASMTVAYTPGGGFFGA